MANFLKSLGWEVTRFSALSRLREQRFTVIELL